MRQQFDSRQAFHAAAASYRLLDRKFKTQTNRSLMIQILRDRPDRILPEDITLGDQIRDYYQSRGLIRMLEDIKNDFERNLIQAATNNTVDYRALGLIAFTPESYVRDTRRENADNKMRWADQNVDWNPEDTIEFTGEIVKCVFSTKWSQYYVTALTTENKLVLFPSRVNWTLGDQVKGSGTVKSIVDQNVIRIRRPHILTLDEPHLDTDPA